MTCVYLSNENGVECLRHGGEAPHCGDCIDLLEIGYPQFADRWQDPLAILDRRGQRTEVLRDLLAGGTAFLLCGGPSANDLPLELLGCRGVWTMAVNNAAGHPRVRPQAFVCADPPSKFSHSIWLDPGVMKFVPTPKLRGKRANLRKKVDGLFSPLDRRVVDCPNVWAYKRWSWLRPDDSFFLTDGACWGNHGAGAERTGQPKTVSTMLLAIRLLRHLGARRVFLVGVDFLMTPEAGYSFGQERDAGACASNNHLFGIVDRWLCEMQENGTFGRFGMELFNTYELSGLRAFPFVPFEQAVEEAIGIVESVPDLSSWYSK